MSDVRDLCPSSSELEDFHAGRLVGVLASNVEDHTEACPACKDALAELSLDDSFVLELKSLFPSGLERSLAPGHVPPQIDGLEIAEELGHGGMGVVWKGRDFELGRVVAVKVLNEKLARDEAAGHRFVTEARITGQLQHPGIVPVYRLGTTTDGRPFLSMKLVKGQTLARLQADLEATLDSPLEQLGIFQRVCEAVAYAHSRGVVHCDLKPGNVMVGSFGEVQVLDWGLAKVIGAEEMDPEASAVTPVSPESGSTQDLIDGKVVGTPLYMSPEQATGKTLLVDQRSDVFSLGMMLLELLVGRPAYPIGRRGSLPKPSEVLADSYQRLDESDLDEELVALTRACLSESVADRPSDAGAVGRSVGEYRASVERRARAAELEAVAARARSERERRARRQAVVIGGFAIGVLALSGVALWQTGRHQALAAERTADTLGMARTLFEKRDYAGSAEVARAGFEQAGERRGPEEQALRRLSANAQLLADLLAHRPRTLSGTLGEAEHRVIRAGFRQAFETHGIDVLASETAVAARYLSATGVADLVRPQLDYWALTERALDGWSSANARRLLDLAGALEEDGQRREIREVVGYSRDPVEIRAFLGPEFSGSLDPSTLVLVLDTLSQLYGHPSRMGDFADARESALRVHVRYEADVEVLLQLGTICYGLGMRELLGHSPDARELTPEARSFFHEAIEHLGGVCTLDPQHASARALLARTYAHLGDERSSEASFAKALREMQDGRRRENRILSYFMALMGTTARVITHLEGLHESDPDAADISSELAWNLCRVLPEGDAKRAVAIARAAVHQQPAVRDYQQVLAIALYHAEEFGECVEILTSLSGAGETAHLGLMRAIALHELGDEEQADLLGRRMLRELGENPNNITRSVVSRAQELFH